MLVSGYTGSFSNLKRLSMGWNSHIVLISLLRGGGGGDEVGDGGLLTVPLGSYKTRPGTPNRSKFTSFHIEYTVLKN